MEDIANKIDGIISNLPSSIDPLLVLELRDLIEELECHAAMMGHADGLREGLSQAAMDGDEQFLRGEAQGVLWAYRAAPGDAVDPMDNPFISRNIIHDLLRR